MGTDVSVNKSSGTEFREEYDDIIEFKPLTTVDYIVLTIISVIMVVVFGVFYAVYMVSYGIYELLRLLFRRKKA